MSKVAWSTGRTSRLKNSRTPRHSPWSRIGTPKPACRPDSSAAGRRRNCGLAGDVRDPLGHRVGPDAARQPGPALRGDLPRHRREPREVQARPGPQRRAAQPPGTRVDPPEHAEVPAQARADRLEDPWAGLAQRVGLGQHARRLVLRRQPPLRLLAPADVVEDHHPALDRAMLVLQRAAGGRDPRPVLAAGIGDVELRLVDRLAPHGPEQRQVLRRIQGDPIGQEDLVMPRPLLGRRVDPFMAEDPLRRRVEDQEPARRVGDDDPVAHAVEDRLQDAGLLAQRQLGARQLLRVLLEALVEPADLLELAEPRQGARGVRGQGLQRAEVELGRVQDRSAWPPGGCRGPRR